MSAVVFRGADVFDGHRLHRDGSLAVVDGRVAGSPPPGAVEVRLEGGILAPGFLDLQVNGAGGRQVDGRSDAAMFAMMGQVHGRLGATGILPTLITDTPEATAAVIAAGVEAAAAGVPGFLGLHLEGPHLDPRRKGAHDPALIRPMAAEDLSHLCRAAERLPSLMVTLAPESASDAQIAALRAAGAVVSLGHSEADCATAQAAMAAGATCVTHLFNAMSQLSNRAPGMVGAALTGPCFAGLIADGIHVAPQAMRVALAAKPAGIFLVSDCMAPAGTDMAEFTLGGRQILRADGRLTLADGTLAGADLTLPRAVSVLVNTVGIGLETALAMATFAPAACLGRSGTLGHLAEGAVADMVHLGDDLSLRAVWRGGERIL